jgi:hypothetical protein
MLASHCGAVRGTVSRPFCKLGCWGGQEDHDHADQRDSQRGQDRWCQATRRVAAVGQNRWVLGLSGPATSGMKAAMNITAP